MTKIKMCGLSRLCDIEAVNELQPEYVGFVFAAGSSRYITGEKAAELRHALAPGIQTVGVFVNETPGRIAALFHCGTIDIAQLHGNEDENYIRKLRSLAEVPVIKAFCMENIKNPAEIDRCSADYVLLDSGAGSGTVFDWQSARKIRRPYFLAGGLSPDNVGDAAAMLRPYAVDVSSGIETAGVKDKIKMAAFAAAVRKEERL